jgi:hypothetical protein
VLAAGSGSICVAPGSGGRIGQGFRFRADLPALQYRNAGLISAGLPGVGARNHGIVTVRGRVSISEFLIVGCQHGWLGRMSYDRGGFENVAIRAASGIKGLFWYGFCSILNSGPVDAGLGRSSGRDRTADGDENE